MVVVVEGAARSVVFALVRSGVHVTLVNRTSEKAASLAGEVNGRANTRPGNGPLGTESQGQARLGMQIRASGLRFDFAGIKGLTKFGPRSGVTVGVTYDTPSIFKPAK